MNYFWSNFLLMTLVGVTWALLMGCLFKKEFFATASISLLPKDDPQVIEYLRATNYHYAKWVMYSLHLVSFYAYVTVNWLLFIGLLAVSFILLLTWGQKEYREYVRIFENEEIA